MTSGILLAKRIGKISIFIIVSLIIVYFTNFFNIAILNSNLMVNLSNLIIASYTALITLFFSISGLHLSKQYGLISADILINKSRRLLIMYLMAISIAIIGITWKPENFKMLKITTKVVSINATSTMIGVEIVFILLFVYLFPKYLLETFRISPVEIIKMLGYPDDVVRDSKKGKLQLANNRLSKGLTLIRICIMDLAMRDELKKVVSIFSKTIRQIPYEDLKKKGVDIGKIIFAIHIRMDECIFDPLISTHLKPDTRIFSRLFCNLTRMYIISDLLNSSLFDEFLDKIYRITVDYVNSDKKEALNEFFFSVLWIFNENANKISDWEVSKVLSKGITLSATLIKLLEAKLNKTNDIKYILFVLSSYLQDWLLRYPRAFIGLNIDDLIYLIEKGDRLFTGSVIIALSRIERELEVIKEEEHEFVYRRTVVNFEKIKAEINKILKTNRWRIFVEGNSLGILNTSDRTIGAIQLKNILNREDIELLRLFIQKHFTPL